VLFADVAEMVEVRSATGRDVYYGEQARIYCIAQSSDESGVEWDLLKNNSDYKTLCSGNSAFGKYECKSNATVNTLIINNVSFDDSGTYMCTEDGGRGPGRDSTVLQVIRK